jgi:hypothetical protein
VERGVLLLSLAGRKVGSGRIDSVSELVEVFLLLRRAWLAIQDYLVLFEVNSHA